MTTTTSTAAPARIPEIVLFDGVCGMCDRFVQFAVRRDRKAALRFASLQSAAGRALLEQYGLPTETLSSMVLIRNGRAFTRSTAALRVCRHLSGLWPLLTVFILVPPFLRNPVYNWISRNRYRWFGQMDACRIPTPEERERFLDDGTT